MQYILLIVVILLIGLQSFTKKRYNVMTETPNVFLFSAVAAFSALLFFWFGNGCKITISSDYTSYSIVFGIIYVLADVATFFAIMWGSLSITGLVSSYSLLIPTCYGLIVLNEKLSVFGMVGIVALLISIYLINDKKEKAKFSLKWVIALAVLFVGNGMCSTIQKMQQMACAGQYKNEFMIISLGIVTVVSAIMCLIRREKVPRKFMACVGFGTVTGVANGIANLLVMVLTGSIPNAILFPSISAGGIVVSFLIAIGIYKERLTRQQLIGYAIGTVSVILLNL